jgi:hypothetical protein
MNAQFRGWGFVDFDLYREPGGVMETRGLQARNERAAETLRRDLAEYMEQRGWTYPKPKDLIERSNCSERTAFRHLAVCRTLIDAHRQEAAA